MANREFATLVPLHVQIARVSSTPPFPLLNLFPLPTYSTLFLLPPPSSPATAASLRARASKTLTDWLPAPRDSGIGNRGWGLDGLSVRVQMQWASDPVGQHMGYLDRGEFGIRDRGMLVRCFVFGHFPLASCTGLVV